MHCNKRRLQQETTATRDECGFHSITSSARSRNDSDIAARSVETGDDAKLHGVPGAGEHDRYRRGCCLGRENRREAARDDDGRRTVDQLSRQHRQTIVLALCPSGFDYDILALDIAGVSQAFAETGQTTCLCGGGSTEHSNDKECHLLRARGERPRGCRSAKELDELPPSHVEHGDFLPGFRPVYRNAQNRSLETGLNRSESRQSCWHLLC